jgi:hypothetical protein
MVNGSALELFRHHFVLYHQLFNLKDLFYAQHKYLHIHFMNTVLVDFPDIGQCRHYFAAAGQFCKAVAGNAQRNLCDFHAQKIPECMLDNLSERYFYFDVANFFAISQENAESFVAGAWQLLVNHQDMLNCYKILGLPENSDLKLVKKHFRCLAKKFHPDLNPRYSKDFSEINDAYRKLIKYLSVKAN